ncbi:four-carbon acid sugar kinase family protein [Sediminicoccus sp. KRV36]|uniref:four-carbon acid sugar kinase family protein n=1 Tax=Sediminicoccus sp. KRV36 TaxID=3133721 RepID=UPI00200DA28D|nr:four-carbon acid sugar kinase family protein [Sediminicoccus rosea]UPY38891.1 four-carbon acid sugar kinase family protein [Sediminicoccus rosea]
MTRPVLRLIADDLTGALDSAAELTGLCGPVPLRWADGGQVTDSLAMDTRSREASRSAAIAAVREVAPALRGADIAFKKIDSLLRGHVAAELAACMEIGRWRHVVLAPAFPAQGRVTRAGRVLVRQAGGTVAPITPDLSAMLAAEGLQAQRGDPAAPLPPGLSVFDAEEDSDLARIVALGGVASGPVLWCGSGGLARALAGPVTAEAKQALRGPVLGLFGSDQTVTTRQLAACGDCGMVITAGDDAAAAHVARMLETTGVAMVSVKLPLGLDRAEAARRIATALAGLTQRLPPPGTLIAAGGETLRALCGALGARGLDAVGIVQPGVPRSVLRGGAWEGVAVVSKSGAFGDDTLWRDLLTDSVLTSWSIPA